MPLYSLVQVVSVTASCDPSTHRHNVQQQPRSRGRLKRRAVSISLAFISNYSELNGQLYVIILALG